MQLIQQYGLAYIINSGYIHLHEPKVLFHIEVEAQVMKKK